MSLINRRSTQQIILAALFIFLICCCPSMLLVSTSQHRTTIKSYPSETFSRTRIPQYKSIRMTIEAFIR